jgi:hypothetical protein
MHLHIRPAALVIAAAALGACSDATPKPAAPAPIVASASTAAPALPASALVDPPDAPIPPLRTGAVAPVEHSEIIEAKVIARHADRSLETLLVAMPIPPDVANTLESPPLSAVSVAVKPGDPRPLALLSDAGVIWSSDLSNARGKALMSAVQAVEKGAPDGHKATVLAWIRRPSRLAGQPVEAEVFTNMLWNRPGHHLRFRVSEASTPEKSDPEILRVADVALCRYLGSDRRIKSRFSPFVTEWCIRAAYSSKKASAGQPARRPTPADPLSPSDLARIMGNTIGLGFPFDRSNTPRSRFEATARETPTIAVEELAAPQAARPPWSEMLRALSATPPSEPLAAATPADFYFVRADTWKLLLGALDAVDLAAPAFGQIDSSIIDPRGLAARYEALLGLPREPLLRALSPEVVSELSVIGSDLLLREGADVTVLFRVKNKSAFDAALEDARKSLEDAHGKLSRAQTKRAGVDIQTMLSADGAVQQYRATLGDLEIVSDSPGAIARVIDAQKGAAPRLSDEPDFRYMLARDAGPRAGLFAFRGERVIASILSPARMILRARRELARIELERPGFAALLYGMRMGRSPASTGDVIAEDLLLKGDLTHAAGGPIAWRPGEPARSRFGAVASPAPLLDLPPVTLISRTEREAYAHFTGERQWMLDGHMSPAAARVSTEAGDQGISMTIRMMPAPGDGLVMGLVPDVGATRLRAAPLGSGLRLTAGIGAVGKPETDLLDLLKELPALKDLKPEWLGGWMMIGLADRSAAANLLRESSRASLQVPIQGEPGRSIFMGHMALTMLHALTDLPGYVGIGVKDAKAAAAALLPEHKRVEPMAFGSSVLTPLGTYRGAPIVELLLDVDASPPGSDDIALYYALDGGSLLLSLKVGILRELIDERTEGRGPAHLPPDQAAPGAPNLTFELVPTKGGGLWTGLGRSLAADAREGADRRRVIAEALLWGAPDRAGDAGAIEALGKAYFGVSPGPPDGGAYSLAPDGARDPWWGTPHAPRWPEVPIPGSPQERLLQALSQLRTELSWDEEWKGGGAPLKSVRAQLRLGLHRQ